MCYSAADQSFASDVKFHPSSLKMRPPARPYHTLLEKQSYIARRCKTAQRRHLGKWKDPPSTNHGLLPESPPEIPTFYSTEPFLARRISNNNGHRVRTYVYLRLLHNNTRNCADKGHDRGSIPTAFALIARSHKPNLC